MTVAELIEELKKYPQDAEVYNTECDEEFVTDLDSIHYIPWYNRLYIDG